MKLTDLETVVYANVMRECEIEYSSDVKTIANDTGLAVNTVKGVVGSLTKKGFVVCEEDDRDGKISDIFAVVDGKVLSYGELN